MSSDDEPDCCDRDDDDADDGRADLCFLDLLELEVAEAEAEHDIGKEHRNAVRRS